MARRYQKMQAMLPEIKQMLEEGKSQREVAEILGLEGDRPVHALLKRLKGNRQYTPEELDRYFSTVIRPVLAEPEKTGGEATAHQQNCQ